MFFGFHDEQLALRDAVADFLARECPPEVVRGAWDGKPTDLWPRLAEMGVPGLLAPEEHGGLGLDELTLVLVLEEVGRAAVPEPLLETAAVAVPTLRDAGGKLAGRWLPALASGEAVATVGLGPAPLVVDADRADLLLDDHDGCLHAVPMGDCELTARRSVDGSRRLFTVAWAAQPGTKLAGADAGLAFDRGALGASAQLLGLAERMVTMAAAHATERHQFGRPVGSFQAVQHRLADALLAVEFARPVVYRAAYAVARDEPERSRSVSMAKAYTSDAAQGAGRAALQVHGAMGYSWEHDLHLFMKRAWALAATWGDAGWHRRRVAELVLDADARTEPAADQREEP